MGTRLGGLDLLSYVSGVGVLVRNPSLLIAPFIMAVLGIVITFVAPGSANGLDALTSGIAGFIVFLLDMFGLGVSLVIADYAWRRGRASFDDGWSEARRKAGDILLAAIGANFIIWIATMAGNLIGGGAITYALAAAALYFMIYAIPAAAIGGIPGGAALQVSIERVQRSYLGSALLTIVSLVVYFGVGAIVPGYFAGFGPGTVLIGAAFKALAIAYIAVILSKHYNDASYGRFFGRY